MSKKLHAKSAIPPEVDAFNHALILLAERDIFKIVEVNKTDTPQHAIKQQLNQFAVINGTIPKRVTPQIVKRLTNTPSRPAFPKGLKTDYAPAKAHAH